MKSLRHLMPERQNETSVSTLAKVSMTIGITILAIFGVYVVSSLTHNQTIDFDFALMCSCAVGLSCIVTTEEFIQRGNT